MGYITQEIIDATTASVAEFWDTEMYKKPDYIGKLYNRKDTDSIQEVFVGVGSIGKMAPWEGTVSYQQFNLGFEKRFIQRKYSSGLVFEEDIFRYRQYNHLEERTALLADTVYKTYQGHGVVPFEGAFDNTLLGPDGQPLCSAAHPFSPEDTTHTQSNVGTDPLTLPNLIKAYKALAQLTDDKGDLLFLQPDTLITGIEYWDEGKKICGTSAADLTPAELNDINVMRSELKYFYHPFITGKKWFLVDSSAMKRHLKWFDSRHPSPERDQDFDTEAIKYKVVGSWSYGYTDYKWIYGNIST